MANEVAGTSSTWKKSMSPAWCGTAIIIILVLTVWRCPHNTLLTIFFFLLLSLQQNYPQPVLALHVQLLAGSGCGMTFQVLS